MARRLRVDLGGVVYHVLNRRVARQTLFEKDADYRAFEKVLAEAHARIPVRILAFCLMPNHWHMVLFPTQNGQLSHFMQWLTTTHLRRWHEHHGTRGTGPVYQGRFRSFPVQRDDHFLNVCRYVERNALRCGLVRAAEDWPWSSLNQARLAARAEWLTARGDWPVSSPHDWVAAVNRVQTIAELEALRACVLRGSPYGDEAWQARTASKLGLQSSLRPPWRPKKLA